MLNSSRIPNAAACKDLVGAAEQLRHAVASAAVTVQLEVANEPARQMGLEDVAPEPLSASQQRQSRIDGG